MFGFSLPFGGKRAGGNDMPGTTVPTFRTVPPLTPESEKLIVGGEAAMWSEVVSPGTSIMTLIDPNSLWVRFDLEQRYVNIVKAGQKALIRLEGVPDKVINGTIYDIGREGEFAVERDVTRGRQDIRTFRTRIKVDDPERILKPGMSVLVEIPER